MAESVEVGALVVATPWLKDPNFSRTVVQLCAHGEEGTMGLVLNRPLELTVGDGLAGVVTPARAGMPLFAGGPVAPSSLFALHRLPQLTGASQSVCDGISFLPGTDDLLEVLQQEPQPGETLRLFAGCAGWAVGQLEAEIAGNAWIVAPSSAAVVFSRKPGSLWARVLAALSPYNAFLARMPEDPRVN